VTTLHPRGRRSHGTEGRCFVAAGATGSGTGSLVGWRGVMAGMRGRRLSVAVLSSALYPDVIAAPGSGGGGESQGRNESQGSPRPIGDPTPRSQRSHGMPLSALNSTVGLLGAKDVPAMSCGRHGSNPLLTYACVEQGFMPMMQHTSVR